MEKERCYYVESKLCGGVHKPLTTSKNLMLVSITVNPEFHIYLDEVREVIKKWKSRKTANNDVVIIFKHLI